MDGHPHLDIVTDAGVRPPPSTAQERAVDRDPALQDRLLRQFDRGARRLRGFLARRLGEEDIDALLTEARAEYGKAIEGLPWIGGRDNPRTFNLYGSALWLALWRVLKPRGVSLEEAGKLFRDIFEAYWSRYPSVLAHLLGRVRMGPRNVRWARRLAEDSQRREHPGDYVYRFVPGEPGRFDFGIDFVECAIIKYLQSEGAEELAGVLCELDWPHTKLLGIELTRNTTLADGSDRCDFRFWRRDALDVGIRRASIPALLVHGLIGWAACGATMGVLMATVPEMTALIVHAVAAPIIFTAITAHLYLRSGHRTPLAVAALFTGLVAGLDALVVAGLVLGTFEMFASPLGTWLPFGLIFIATILTGTVLSRRALRPTQWPGGPGRPPKRADGGAAG